MNISERSNQALYENWKKRTESCSSKSHAMKSLDIQQWICCKRFSRSFYSFETLWMTTTSKWVSLRKNDWYFETFIQNCQRDWITRYSNESKLLSELLHHMSYIYDQCVKHYWLTRFQFMRKSQEMNRKHLKTDIDKDCQFNQRMS